MAKTNSALRLLLLEPTQNEAQALISMLRNAGIPTRAHTISSEEDLEKALSEETWDLMVAHGTGTEPSAADALSQVRTLKSPVPVIVISSGEEELDLELLNQGALDILPQDQSARLLHAIRRETASLANRRRREELEVLLGEAETRCHLLLENSRDPVAYIAEGMHVYANAAYLHMLEYPDFDELMCVPVVDTISPTHQSVVKQLIKPGQAPSDAPADCVLVTSSGAEVAAELSFSAATYDGERCIQIIARLNHPAATDTNVTSIDKDGLTGLMSKASFSTFLEREREQLKAQEGHAALLFVEINHLGSIKSRISVSAGDSVVRDLAALLGESSQEGMTLARLGDDSFGLHLPDPENARELAEALRRGIQEKLFAVGDKTVQMTASIGVVKMNANTPGVDELYEQGHKACRRVAEVVNPGDQGNGIYVYNALDFEVKQDGDMVATLQQALDDDRFKLLFQPIISLRGDEREHYEGFLRMINNDGREMRPTEFLPVDRHGDLAVKLDRWVVLQNIKSLAEHRNNGHDTCLILNITHFTLIDPDFLNWLSLALNAAKLPGGSLVFQIPEEHAIQYLRQAREFSDGLRALGCPMSLSRFGCALNPMNTLKHVDASYIKVDGSFTEEIQKSEEAREKFKQLVDTLKGMDRRVVVPLVESAATLSTLWQAGVDYIQGYYLRAPSERMDYDFSESD